MPGQLVLGIGVHPGGVEKADAAVVGLLKKPDGVVIGHPLDGQGAEGVFVYGDPRGTKGDSVHRCTSW